MASPTEQLQELMRTLDELPPVFQPGVRMIVRRAFNLGVARGFDVALASVQEAAKQENCLQDMKG